MGFKPRLTTVKTKVLSVPDDKKAKVTIKYIKDGVMQEIIQSTMQVTSRQQGASDKMASEISFSLNAKNIAVVKECVTDWEFFEDEYGKPMRFTQVNLAKMIEESSEFVTWIVEEHDKFAEEVESEAEVALKN